MLPAVLIAALLALLLWCLALRCRRGHPLWRHLRAYRYAHRGLHGPGKPENSLAAFHAAAAAGYGAELDVHLSADGQLVVMHDSATRRMCGADYIIERSTWDMLRPLTLDGTEEHIPLLEDVLPLFQQTAPLIIELKTAGSNAAALCARVFDLLDHYPGAYCVESFDPRVLLWLRRHRPAVCRGQLSCRFDRKSGVPGWQRFALSRLLSNFLTVPDFVAYCHTDRRHNAGLALCRRLWGAQEVSWTVRTAADMRQQEQQGCLIIFEQFCP